MLLYKHSHVFVYMHVKSEFAGNLQVLYDYFISFPQRCHDFHDFCSFFVMIS